MKVVSDAICPFAQRVIAVLELKGVNHEVELISLGDKPKWFLKASPNAQVPILIEDRGVLFESSAICEYLDEAYGEPKLHPQDPFKRAQHRAWAELAAKNYLVQCPTMRSTAAEIFEERKAKFLTAFEKVEKVLAEGPYFDGGRLSMVDAVWHPLLYRAAVVEKHTGFDFLSAFPKAKKWQQELMKIDALARSVPEDFEKAFVGFYLNDQTYLGSLMREMAA
jgi:glutathione S-transferase